MNTRHMSPRKVMLATVVIASVGLTAGCGSSSSPEPTAEIETVPQSPTGSDAVASITWNMGSGEPSTLFPPNVPTYSGMALVSNLCDSLLSLDEDGTIIPGLATVEMTTATRAVFTIRGNPTFWDGTPLTSDDIVYSMNLAAGPTSYLAPSYARVTSITAVSDTEVAVEFSQPDAGFLPTMAGVGGAIMQRAFTEQAGEAVGTPSVGLMCSGPFELGEWNAGTDITVTKNADYWDAERAPLVEEVRLTFIADTSAMTQALATGEIDGGWEIPSTAVPALESSDVGDLYFGDTTSVWSLRVSDPESELATNPKLREAFQHLVDRDAIADVVFSSAAQPWSTAISPNSWPVAEREQTLDAYNAFASAREYDPELAAQLVEEADATGEELEVIVASGDETASKIALLLQEQAKAVGLDLSITPLQPIEYSQALYDPTLRAGSDLLLGINGDVVQEPLTSIRYYFLPDGLYNWDGFVDEQLPTLFEQAITTADPTERVELTLDIQSIYEANGGTIAIVNPYQVNFVNDRIGGVITSWVYTNMPSLTFIGGR